MHPEWAGPMDPDHCAKARALFGGRVAFYNPQLTVRFWSSKWTVEPQGPSTFELPFGVRYKTCTILVRMAKDYGDEVIVYKEPHFDEIPMRWAHLPPETFVSWSRILWAIDGMLQDVQSRKNPIWDYLQDICILFIPSSSAISRQWSVGMRSSWANVREE
ncbi:MAG: hypothetical protein Q9215_006827 [Flavoplaca cf. flavocitrina]